MSGITPLLQTLKELEKKNIPGEYIQSCYYLAAYLLSSSGSSDIQLIADYGHNISGLYKSQLYEIEKIVLG